MGSVYVLVHLLGYVIFSYYPLWSLCSLSQIPMTVWSLILSPRLFSLSSFQFYCEGLLFLVCFVEFTFPCLIIPDLLSLCFPPVSSLPRSPLCIVFARAYCSVHQRHFAPWSLYRHVSLPCVSLLVQTWVLFWFLFCLMLVFHQFNNGLAFC